MPRARLVTGAAALMILMAGTAQQTMAQQASVSVRVVVAPISRISFTGMPGDAFVETADRSAERASDPAYLALEADRSAGRATDPAYSALEADAVTSADPANDARLTAPSFTAAGLRTRSSQSLEFPGAEAVDDGQSLCATATDRRSARSTGPMPWLSMSYSAHGGDSKEQEPTITCTLIAP